MAPPDTGRYIITNVKFLNLAVLPDANDDSDIVAKTEENDLGEKVCYYAPVWRHYLSLILSGI